MAWIVLLRMPDRRSSSLETCDITKDILGFPFLDLSQIIDAVFLPRIYLVFGLHDRFVSTSKGLCSIEGWELFDFIHSAKTHS